MMSWSAPSSIVILSLLTLPAAAAEAPPYGVYSCYDAMMDYQMRLSITPMPFVMFGLINDNTYSDYDGHHGHYRYDAGTGVLTMLDGSREGWRYHKDAAWAFRLIDNKNGTEIYTCPFEAAKDPNHGPW